MNSEKDSHETRKRILDAAKSEFANNGYDGARMGAIARKAKVTEVRQSLYQHHDHEHEHPSAQA